MTQQQNEYRVTWTIEVEADDALAAARVARTIQLDPNSTAQVFNVRTVGSSDEAEFDLVEGKPPTRCPHCGGTNLAFQGEHTLRRSMSGQCSVHEWACRADECGRPFWS